MNVEVYRVIFSLSRSSEDKLSPGVLMYLYLFLLVYFYYTLNKIDQRSLHNRRVIGT